MKKIIVSSLLSIISLLTVQFVYIQIASKSELIELISNVKEDKGNSEKFLADANIKKVTVVEVNTGYQASNLWNPSIIVKFQNISNGDLNEYIQAKAVFLNTSTNEQIGVHTKYLSTTNDLFLQGTTLRKQFISDVGFRGSPSNLNISVKLYLEDELIGTYKIINKQI